MENLTICSSEIKEVHEILSNSINIESSEITVALLDFDATEFDEDNVENDKKC